jgi:putative transcriptional regulator
VNYNSPIEFEWDENKSDRCLRQRGFDFAYAAQVFFDPARIIQADARLTAMKTRRMKLDPTELASSQVGHVDLARVDATTEEQIARHKSADEQEALEDAGKFARRVRRRLGLSQSQFSERINVSLDTIRNWEQGKRYPTGAAKALLTILDRAPEAALRALR